ncbi:unnamed protein product, partial [Citrullus colocynthis]
SSCPKTQPNNPTHKPKSFNEISEVDVRMQIADSITDGLRVVDVDLNSNFDYGEEDEDEMERGK